VRISQAEPTRSISGDGRVTHFPDGLLPCPAVFTILLDCLQVKQVTLGFALVLCFSVGLALTLVTTGAVAAWSVRHASKRIKGFGEFARKAPYFSSALLVAMGLYIAFQGWRHLS
jgi:nickel/cobalt exporter